MAFGLITIGIMAIEFLSNIITNERIIDNGIEAEAIIYDKKRVHVITGSIPYYKYNIYVEYEINGQIYKSKVTDYKGDKVIGDRIVVYCDSNNYSNITTKEYVEKETSKAILPIIIYMIIVIKVIYETINYIKNK